MARTTDWSGLHDMFILNGYVSCEKLSRFSWTGNYIASLIDRKKLIEGVHWHWVSHNDVDWETRQPIKVRTRYFYCDAVCELFENGFKDDTQIWVAFNHQRIGAKGILCQHDISEELDNALLNLGCIISGYNRLNQRKFYTLEDDSLMPQVMQIATEHNTVAGVCED